jgi:pimaricinolide synthase PimS1
VEPSIDAQLAHWPPANASMLDLETFYPLLAARGLSYGPAFRGLTEAYADGDHIHGRAVLPDPIAETAGDYGLHPALLDAALHVLFMGDAPRAEDEAPPLLLPFAWSDATLHAAGSTELRVRLDRCVWRGDEATASLTFVDASAQPVITVGALHLRRATAEQIEAASTSGRRNLYEIEWPTRPLHHTEPDSSAVVLGGDGFLARQLGVPHVNDIQRWLTTLGDSETSLPGRLLIDATVPARGTRGIPQAARDATAEALELLKAVLRNPSLTSTPAIWVTRRAIATDSAEAVAGLAAAPLWGLLRSARTEHPDRLLRLVDISEDVEPDALWAGLRDEAAELALRGGEARAPRLAVVPTPRDPATVASLKDGTVLITGGLGELGQALARHLVARHQVRHLLLTSRRGSSSPGAAELIASLRDLGANEVTVTACDVADRTEVAAVLDSVSPEQPLVGIFHLAGVLDDAVVEDLDANRIARVLRPKVDGAWHLHNLTEDRALATFVLFSSAAGVLGSAGQGNYAAANAFLDALASDRRARGHSATSLAWGLWEQQGLGMTAHLGTAEIERLRRQGLAPMPVRTGLSLLDAALEEHSRAHLVPMRLDLGRLRARFADTDAVPSLFSGLVRPSLRRVGAASAAASSLRQRLARLPEVERRASLVALVRDQVAAVLGLSGGTAVPSDQPIKDLGMDSLMAVELRNQLSARADTSLPTTLAFDYPTPEAIADLLMRLAFAELDAEVVPVTEGRGTTSNEPIAIVAMACRTPGGGASPEDYWVVLEDGRDVIGPFPERWDTEALYDPDPEAAGKTVAREGGFIDGVEGFDAAFFGISPREAVAMDPQQRLVLEVAWEALERAGLPSERLAESQTGVYLGSLGSDYPGLESLEDLDGYRSTGQASSVLSGRLSYVLGASGPAMTIDTACSSSLVALHLACSGLRNGECDLAIAGGVQVMSTPSLFVEFSRLRGMAPDGRCKAFSPTPTAPDGPKAAALSCSSASRMLGETAAASLRSSAEAPSIRTAAARA